MYTNSFLKVWRKVGLNDNNGKSGKDFPGGPVAKTLRSQCRGPRFDGTRSHTLQQRWKIPHATTKTQHSQINQNTQTYTQRHHYPSIWVIKIKN